MHTILPLHYGPWVSESALEAHGCLRFQTRSRPSNPSRRSSSILKADILAGRIKECLMVQAELMVDPDLTVRTLPSKTLFANSEIAVGKLRLSPVSATVMPVDKRKKANSINQANSINPMFLCTLKRPDQSTTVYQMSQTSVDENMCCAFFVLQATHTEELANMVMTHEEVSFIPAAKKLKIAGNEHNVKIPVFSNNSIIKPGEELLTFVKKVEKPATPPVAHSLVHRPTKKAKVSSR